MQHLDHDMDDLFEKAGEYYPLKTEGDDFDKVFAKMEVPPVGFPVTKIENDVDFRLLLAGIFCCFILFGWNYISSKRNHLISGELITRPGTLKAGASGTHEAAGNDRIIQKDTLSLKKATIINREKDQAALHSDVVFHQALAKGIHINRREKNNNLFKQRDSFSQERSNALLSLPAVADLEISADEHILKQSVVKRMPLTLPYAIIEPGLNLAPVIIFTKNKQEKGLYLGLTGAPEWSRVGSQTITRSGFRGGVLVGYRFNSKLSIESGVTLGKNNYYSEGSYFKMSRMLSYMPAGMEILTLDGQTTNLEIPVTIKYDVLQRQRSRLFFTGGILSNIFLREKNHYQTMLNGIKDNQMGMYPENHVTIASQVRLSAGYERILSRSNNLRIEPYKNIPLRKIGMGSMPVFSSGVNIGVVHFFRK